MPSLSFLARRFDTGEPVRVSLDDARILSVAPAPPPYTPPAWPLGPPRLFDLQINGYAGTWFSNAQLTPAQVSSIARSYLKHGVTRLCPTLITNSSEAITAALSAINSACLADPLTASMIPGIHLEGPFISPEDGPRGAHPRQHVRSCDWSLFQSWQAASGNRIRLITLAPESPGAPDFIRRAVAAQVTVAIGHTAATDEQIAAACDAGATLSTHLGNGAHAVLPRHPNYIWTQLAEPRLWASIITDGHHLPGSVAQCIATVKGFRRTIITCDASGLAGSPPGRYECFGQSLDVLPTGRISVADQPQYLAGSANTTEHCVAWAIAKIGFSMADAINFASRIPARLLGFEEFRLLRGSRGDLILFDFNPAVPSLNIHATFLEGRLVHGSIPEVS